MKRKLLSILLICTSIFTAACSKTTEDPEIIEEEQIVEIARNDYYGGVQRISKIQTDTYQLIQNLQSSNYNIIQGNPTDYWSDPNYFFFDFNPCSSAYMPYTIYLNETDEWDTILSQVAMAYGENYDTSVEKQDVNKYKISSYGVFYAPDTQDMRTITNHLYCYYDAGHDYLQMRERTVPFNFNEINGYEEGLYEFARLDKNSFVIQTEKERLYIHYNDNNEIQEFYYSLLDESQDRESLINALEELQSQNPDVWDVYIDGRMTNHYLSSYDSIFQNIENIDEHWVLEEPNVNQYIIYRNHTLTCAIQNYLTKNIEIFKVKEPIPGAVEIKPQSLPLQFTKESIYYDALLNEDNTLSLTIYDLEAVPEEGQDVVITNQTSEPVALSQEEYDRLLELYNKICEYQWNHMDDKVNEMISFFGDIVYNLCFGNKATADDILFNQTVLSYDEIRAEYINMYYEEPVGKYATFEQLDEESFAIHIANKKSLLFDEEYPDASESEIQFITAENIKFSDNNKISITIDDKTVIEDYLYAIPADISEEEKVKTTEAQTSEDLEIPMIYMIGQEYDEKSSRSAIEVNIKLANELGDEYNENKEIDKLTNNLIFPENSIMIKSQFIDSFGDILIEENEEIEENTKKNNKK